MDMEKIAHWAFVAFVIIAIVMGLVVGYMAWNATLHWTDTTVADDNAYIVLVLIVLGIIVGLVSITAKEVTPFLIGAIALIVANAGFTFWTIPNVGLNETVQGIWAPLYVIHHLLYYWATTILSYITAFVAPAAVIIAIKSIFAMERMKAPPA